MYRFLVKPRWLLFHLLVLLLVVVMINLGLWQMHRLQHRKDFNAEVRARASEPVVPVEDVVTLDTDGADVQWRTVTATGTYLPDEQVIVVNRSQDGFSGVNVVTPLELADGELVLINRGFVADTLDVPAAPSGTVTVTGRLRETQERSLGQLTEPDGVLDEVFRIDIPRLAEQLPAPVLPVYVDLLSSQPAQGDVPVPLPDPDLSEGPHLSYMIQWWIFSACAVVGWVLAVRRSIRQHRRDLDAAAAASADADQSAVADATADAVSAPAGRTPPGSPTPDDAAATTAHD
jgi:cytochrome oxidase assembly protein ShyY1